VDDNKKNDMQVVFGSEHYGRGRESKKMIDGRGIGGKV